MSGGDWSPPCRWRTCPRCTPSQWWTDAGIGCCWGKWWIGAVSGLRCSCLGYWMRSACGSSARILQRAAYVKWIRKSSKEERKGKVLTLLLSFFDRLLGNYFLLTVTLEPLSDQPKQHFPAVIAEGRGPVWVHVERMWTNLEVFRLCRRWNR